jgi:predicted nucleic acid-binding protein
MRNATRPNQKVGYDCSYEVLRVSSESKCFASDCEFIAAANDLKVPLITVDKQLPREFPAMASSLTKFCG